MTRADADDAHFEFHARYDYNREAYGDPCPGCGTLRWQADCPNCYREDEDVPVPPLASTLVHDLRLGAAPGILTNQTIRELLQAEGAEADYTAWLDRLDEREQAFFYHLGFNGRRS